MTWKYGSWGKYLPVKGRVLISLLFIIAGWGKLMGFSGTAGYMASLGFPMPELVAVLVIVIELGGGIALALGVHARAVALALAVFTLLATLIAHRDIGDQMQLTQALKNLAVIGGLIYVAKYGSGMWSLGRSASCGCCDHDSCVCEAGASRSM